MIQFVCIGTDRSTGDAFGPLVGTRLKELGYNVLGTLDEPVHGMNLAEKLKQIPSGAYVIAVDACLGNLSSVGKVIHKKGPAHPGSGLGKKMTPVGDCHYYGVVNIGGIMEHFVLQSTRLSLVMKMVNEAVEMIRKDFPLEAIEEVAASVN
jgi:putative sporulation protein YyaC